MRSHAAPAFLWTGTRGLRRTAKDGSSALRRLRSDVSVDMLVTDVGLPVLFITGYAGNALEGQLAPGMQVIGKPSALNALAAKVRMMLEAPGLKAAGLEAAGLEAAGK